MDDCDCIGSQWAPDDILMQYQYASDFFIALAYFSIPLELIYFVKKSAVFPYRWVLVQFGLFIVLCGATHVINMWTFREHTRTVAMVMTIAKVLTAVVSCATALMLVHIIPDLLSVKTRELFLKNKAAELDREMGVIKTKEETGRYVRVLTQEIRASLDRHTILNTTLVELGRTLDLEECTLWMPTRDGMDLTLAHALREPNPMPVVVPLAHPTVKQVFSSNRAVVISPNAPVAVTGSQSPRNTPGDVVAVRVPLIHVSSFNAGADWQDSRDRSYALLVLILSAESARRWHVHELEMVEVVADQVAVGLSHAAILEDSLRARDLLVKKNIALDHARREAETAIRARNDFLAVMNHEMRIPMHAIIALCTLLQETELTPEQRSMVDTVLKSSNLLALLINDVLYLSRLEDGSVQNQQRQFNLHSVLKEVTSLVKPVAAVKKVSVTLRLQPDVPEMAVGDDKSIMQTALNVVGNAVKFTKEGSVTITACLERSEFTRDKNYPKFNPVPGPKEFYVRVQVRDTGIGVKPEELRKVFNRFAQGSSISGSGLGLAIARRFVHKMGGHIWAESEGPNKGTVTTFVIKLSHVEKNMEDKMGGMKKSAGGPEKGGKGGPIDFTGLKVLVCDDNHVNRMVTKRMVTRLGCDVTVVNSGRECLAATAGPGHGFKVVLLDLMMPDMDGYEVARRIIEKYKNNLNERPKICALTANTDQPTKDRCIGLGMDGVITKPISLEKMNIVFTELMELGKIVSDPKA